MEGEGLISLEELSKNSDFILVDTYAFFSFYGKPYSTCKGLSEKLTWKLDEANSITFWEENLSKIKNLYVTSEVFEDIQNRGYYLPYFKKEYENSPLLFKFKDELKRCSQKRLSLLNLIQEQNRIIELDEEDLSFCNELIEKYSSYWKILGRPLEDAKIKFLISGTVLSVCGDVSLISNNVKLMFAWKELLKKENFTKRHLAFYFRKELNGFLEAY